MRALPHLARSATVAAPAESPGIRSVDKDVGGGRLNVVDTGLRNGIRIWTAMEDTLAEMIAKGTPGPGAQRLVSIVPRMFPLLSQPPQSTRSLSSADSRTAFLRVNFGHRIFT